MSEDKPAAAGALCEPEVDPELDADPDLDAAIQALTPAERMRERSVWLWLGLGGLIVLVLFLLVFWPVMQGRLNAGKQVDQAIALLRQAEGTTASVDKTVALQLSPDALPSAPNVAAEILVARRDLGQASRLLDDAMPHLTEEEQHRAALAKAAVQARLATIDNAPAILIASVKAVQAKTLGDRAWKLTLRASANEIEAAHAYELQTASAVETASVAIATIQGELGDARQLYSQAASAFPDAGFERYMSYVDARRSEVALLSQASMLWLGDSRAQAKKTFARYESSLAVSAAALALLPYAPGTATGTAFRKIAGSHADAYAKAKKQADEADKALETP